MNGLDLSFCLAQACNPVARFPLAPFFQKLQALKPLKHIPFSAQSGSRSQTPML
jgi:hypothetical protein